MAPFVLLVSLGSWLSFSFITSRQRGEYKSSFER